MNKKNILLVEDDAIIGMYEKSLLEKEGYNVTHCLSGERALQQIKLDNFDIILMDIDLGKGINGVETAEIILKDNNIPIVFISSHTERDIIEKTESINSYGYIVKNSFETAIFTIIKMAFKLFESNKKIENALKISNEKEKILNSIFNAIPDFIGILDPEFQIIKSNKSLYEFLGLDKNISKGNHYFELFEKEKKEQKESFFEEFINTKGIFKQQIYKKDLNRYFDVMLYPIIEDNGEIINFVEHIRDITEAKKITKAIEEKGEMLSITLQSIGDAVIATDIDCNITLMNKTAEEITGWNFNEAKGKNLLEILKLYDSETMTPIKIPFGLMTSSKERYDLLDNTLLVDKNGNRYIIADSIGVIKDSEENIMGFIIVFSNITERYNLTKQLKTKDAFISSILNSNPNIMLYQILTDINDKERREFIFLTESVKNLYNVTEEEAKKDSSLIYNRVIEEDREKLRAEEEKCLLNNTPLKIEIRLYNPDNSIRWSRIISTPFKISETEVLWNGIEIDITEEKKNMDKLSLLITEKETILKEVHHRIKNNMNIILSLLRLQIEQYKENKEIENILNDASSRIKSMMILYDTLYLSKKKTEISTKDYLSSLIDGIVEIFPKKIELTVKKEIQDFMLNEKILSTICIILNELITNSIKHAFCGRKKGTITFILSKSNGNIVMIFKDDGIGMPAEFNIENSPGFGSKLISLLISQINGVLSINSSNGIEYNIRFSI